MSPLAVASTLLIMDVATGLTVLGTAIGSAKVVEKILGPTTDYLGEGLKLWTQKRVENTSRIFKRAQVLLGDDLNLPGAVPPKVLHGILNQGSFCDDELAAQYFGGVLASSRTAITRDDRGVSFVALLGRLSTYQIRTHFILYHSIRSLFLGSETNIATSEGRHGVRTFIPYAVYVPAMAFTEQEDVASILTHAMFGLARESLVEQNFNFGNVEYIEYIQRYYPDANQPGIVFAPSALGVELVL